eukprot:scaffold15086_cov132-Skeletonema_marinoi.AAC.3
MFRESANFEKAEAEANNANMLPPAMNSRNLHSLFDDAHGNLRMGNSTTDHYHRPAAGAGGIKDQGAKAATVDDATLGQTDNQTLSFTLIFLSLMVVYIGFCCHYRKVKIRRSYDDSAHSQNANNNNNRQRRQRDNQAVLDESSSAANRAAADSEEQRKLEERRVRIGEVLWTRLIVDDEDEEGGHVAEPYLNVNGGGDEENQVNANDDESHEKSDLVDEEMGNEEAAAAEVEGKTLAQDEDAAATAGTLAKQEEEEEAPSIEETTIATVPSSSEETISTIPSNEDVPTIGTSPSSSTAVAPSTQPPSSPFRKYADALSCNNCHHHATNYCNNQHINCNNDATTSSSSPAGNKSSNNSLTTITLSDIQQTYGDECNICLSTFQVGDRAAWSKHHFNGCVHVFHDACMKRWLLVRDGCPICRRLYLGEGTMKKGLVPTPQDDGEGESGRDLESGGGGMGNAAIITVEEE